MGITAALGCNTMNALKVALRKGGLPTRFAAEVTGANGEILCRCTVETVLLVHNYEMGATTTEPQVREACYLLDGEIALQAQCLHISKVMMSIPEHQLPTDGNCSNCESARGL